MYYNPFSPQCYYYVTVPMYNDGRSVYWTIPNEMEKVHRGADLRSSYEDRNLLLKDYGPKPFVVNINRATKQNNTFRTALWTGKHFQVTLMRDRKSVV